MTLPDRFRIERVLAERDACTTRLATDTTSGERVIVKTLSVRGAKSAEEVDLFRREHDVLQHLVHPQLPRVLGAFTEEAGDDVLLHHVRAYVDGTPLFDEVAAGRHTTEREALLLVRSAAVALTVLHGASPAIVHRDLKPQNLVRTANGEVSVIDFGAVRGGRSQGATVVGTFGYMPPEQFEGRALPASDVYALGMTLVFLLTHKEPVELADEGVRETWRRYANVSDAAADLVERMIAYDPARRPRDAAALVDAIDGVLSGRGPVARPAAEPRLVVAAVTGLLVLAGVGIAFFAVRAATPEVVEVVPAVQAPPPPPPPAPPSVEPRVPRPPRGAPLAPKGPLGLSDLDAPVACLTAAVPRVRQSKDRYLSWASPEGPTCRERIVYGLYTGYDYALERCRRAVDEARGEPARGALQALLDAEATVLPLLQQADRYYDQKDYLDDGCATGKALHPKLMDAFAALERADAAAREALLGKVFQARLRRGSRSLEAAGAARGAVAAHLVGEAVERAGRKPGPCQSPDAAKEWLAWIKKGQEDLGPPSGGEDLEARLVARVDEHLTWLKKLARGCAEGASRRHGGDGWDPHDLLRTTWDLLGDVIDLDAEAGR